MARRNYSVVEVEGLIPSLEEIFSRIFQLRIGLRAIEKKLERAGVSVDVEGALRTSASPSGEDASDSATEATAEGDDDDGATTVGSDAPGARHAQAVFRGYYEALSDGLEEIRAMGGDVKDLDQGLVDFPGKRGNDDILLCWRLGEKRIEYWHTVEGGFANRRRLDERIPRTPSRAE